MRNEQVFRAWLTAATTAARRGRKASKAEEEERDRLWRAVEAEGFTPGECLTALEREIENDGTQS